MALAALSIGGLLFLDAGFLMMIVMKQKRKRRVIFQQRDEQAMMDLSGSGKRLRRASSVGGLSGNLSVPSDR